MTELPIHWTTERRKVKDLHDHPKNPRQFTRKGMEDLQKSIEACGYVEPIAINLNNTILSGHARKKILLAAGLTEIDVRVPDRELTEAEEREVLIRMNRNVAGQFDFDMLANEWDMPELLEFGFEPYEIGVSLEDLKDVPGMPQMGERLENRISLTVLFDSPEEKETFLKSTENISLLRNIGNVSTYHYPAIGHKDNSAFAWNGKDTTKISDLYSE